MKIKTKAFTLIELILILLIVGIMFRIWYFAYERDKINKEILEWQQCANSVFWKITEYINLAKKKQSLYINPNTTIYPKYYIIEFSGNNIDLKYTTWGISNILYENLITPTNLCFNDVEYKIDKNISIQITPWFKSNEITNLSSFKIQNNDGVVVYGWELILQKCENELCYQIAKFTTNSKTNEITRSVCWEYKKDNGSECSKWR